MRVLVVMTHYPFPPHSGSTIVAYNSMKHLAKHYVIDFICLEPMGGAHPAEFVEHLELVRQSKVSRFALWLRYVRGMVAGVPYSVTALASPQMKDKVKKAVKREKYVAILLFEMSAIQYCPPDCYEKVIINIEDPLSIKLSRMAELSVWSLWQRAKLYVLAKLTAKYERRTLPEMAKVLLLSASDMQDMREDGGYVNLSCMPYGVDLGDSAEITGYEKRERAIVFSGNMHHPPNVDGLLYFLKDIFPLIIKEYPSVLLWVVGEKPDDRIYEAAAKFGKSVVITGRVADITVYIKQAAVSICPVRLKIGVQTKILEALSCGTPIVTTSAGNSGIGGISGTQFWVEDESQQFAHRVVALLQGRGWLELSGEGRKLVKERFSWEGSVAHLDMVIDSLIEKNG